MTGAVLMCLGLGAIAAFLTYALFAADTTPRTRDGSGHGPP